MRTKSEPTIGQNDNGPALLIGELKAIIAIYGKDLKTFREGGTEMELLGNSDMFDIVMKLLSVGDKIKKLGETTEAVSEEPVAKVRNIQDFTLNKGKLEA